MRCQHCGAELAPRALFCRECGERATIKRRFCKNCGAEISDSAKYCSNCGSKIEKELVGPDKIILESLYNNSENSFSEENELEDLDEDEDDMCQLPPTKVGGLKAPKKEKSIFGDLQLIQIQQARYRSAKSVVEASQ